jgi:hypothetical protein
LPSRLKALGRMAAIYQLMEYADGVTLDQARAALHEMETRIRDRANAASRLDATGYEALLSGDDEEWLLDRSQVEFVQWNADALEEIRQEREAAMKQAAEAYQASRMQFEKMQSVLNEARLSAARERERAEQRASDDRYLSRPRWESHGRGRRKADAERVGQAAEIMGITGTA